MFSFVEYLVIDLIGNYVEVVIVSELDKPLHLVVLLHRTSGVCRRVDDQGFCLVRDAICNGVRLQPEVIISAHPRAHGDAARHQCQWLISDESWIREYDLVARIDQRLERQMKSLAATRSAYYLLLASLDSVLFIIARDRVDEFRKSLVRSVPGVAPV